MAQDLRIFISWSGPLARDAATALREWLIAISDRFQPWMSSTDIEAGARSMNEVANELNGTRFGIVVVTRDNQRAPWLNFEAGALSKEVAGEKARVMPILVDVDSPTEITGPIAQYQIQRLDRAGVLKVLNALGRAAGIDADLLNRRFTNFWPELSERIEAIREEHQSNARGRESLRSERELIEEMLLRLRSMQLQDSGRGYRATHQTLQRISDANWPRIRQIIEAHGNPYYEVGVPSEPGFDLGIVIRDWIEDETMEQISRALNAGQELAIEVTMSPSP